MYKNRSQHRSGHFCQKLLQVIQRWFNWAGVTKSGSTERGKPQINIVLTLMMDPWEGYPRGVSADIQNQKIDQLTIIIYV